MRFTLEKKHNMRAQIHPSAFVDAHRRWQPAFSLDMLNSDRWFWSHVCQNIAWRSLSMRILSRTFAKLLCICLHSVQPSRHQLRWIWTISLRQGGAVLSFVAKRWKMRTLGPSAWIKPVAMRLEKKNNATPPPFRLKMRCSKLDGMHFSGLQTPPAGFSLQSYLRHIRECTWGW